MPRHIILTFGFSLVAASLIAGGAFLVLLPDTLRLSVNKTETSDLLIMPSHTNAQQQAQTSLPASSRLPWGTLLNEPLGFVAMPEKSFATSVLSAQVSSVSAADLIFKQEEHLAVLMYFVPKPYFMDRRDDFEPQQFDPKFRVRFMDSAIPNLFDDAQQNGLETSPIYTPELMAHNQEQQTSPPVKDNRRSITIVQFGDSHTAADMFTGRVRERLQATFGTGGLSYLVPGVPHPGVRSAEFAMDVSPGWHYEALQKSQDKDQFDVTGFNALSEQAGATLKVIARSALPYESFRIDFKRAPNAGKAQIFTDGLLQSEIDLRGNMGEVVSFSSAPTKALKLPFHTLTIRAATQAPITVTAIALLRAQKGLSYINLGFPGATVKVLQKMSDKALKDGLAKLNPDVIVLAFGTNEGFNDALNASDYQQEFEKIIQRLKFVAPQAKIIIIAPPDGARQGDEALLSNQTGAGCQWKSPPKLPIVRAIQQHIAVKLQLASWDWSSIMPQTCSAQQWVSASPSLMTKDHVHFTSEGYKKSADKFSDFLITWLNHQLGSPYVVSNP